MKQKKRKNHMPQDFKRQFLDEIAVAMTPEGRVARILKADPETRDIHIVAMTSFPEMFTKAAALEAGCDAYSVKPLSTRGLPRQLENTINSTGPP